MASQSEAHDGLFDDIVQTRLPLSKVKKIAKVDPNVHMINAEAVKLMAKGAESFVALLAKAAYTQAVLDKRKTIQTKDIDAVVKQSPVFHLLQGALDNWIEPEKVEKPKCAEEEESGEVIEAVEDMEEETEEPEDNEDVEHQTEEVDEEDADYDKENELLLEDAVENTTPIEQSNQESLLDTVLLGEEKMEHN